ncbi:ninja-family protein mc410-like [Rutidosis leptorrhynchoides]|uniref:ninja-family protein mc410-like n=1 Tax=Rutidosis leptorrhynchoides TaxID=125765 RepID=UPI003A9909D3
MEGDNRLDLSLSLPCGGPSSDVKCKTSGGSEVRVEEADRGSKLINDFKNFLDGSNHKEETIVGSQRSSQSKPDENIFYDLSSGPANVDNAGLWTNKEGVSKRKNVFDEMNNQKRHDRDVYLAGLHVKATRTPHVSITTDEGSTAENEDVADSEAEGSTSKLAHHRDDPPKSVTASVGLSEGCNEVRVSEPSGLDLQGHGKFTISSGKEYNVGHVSHGVLFSGQPANILNMPYSLSVNESNSIPVTQNNQVMASGSNNRSRTATPANVRNSYERAKGDSIHAKEVSSTDTEGGSKGTNGIDHSKEEAFTPEYPAIKPGIAAELKFGGSGSSPNLPWVSTTGPGPNGKTISGVTYKYTGTQIQIVCACHGSHMSPEEFVQHASEKQPNVYGGGDSSSIAVFPNGNPTASAQN